MIIVKLIGGLGNQMFQYAVGQSLAQVRKIGVAFDLTELLDRTHKENFTYRDFELGVFEACVDIATDELLLPFTCKPNSLLKRVYYKVLRIIKQVQYYKENKYFVYEPGVWHTSPNTYLDGYWQSELYFKQCEQLVRTCFKFKAPLAGKNQQLAQQIQSENSISIHVRRGDYVSNQHLNEVHGTCSPAYYQAAISLITNQVENPTLYVFSDEPEWVAQNMLFDYPVTYISHNTGANSFEDMRLMSLCTHNIIANSSFSWWGAWLNSNPHKLVVAPQRWMQSNIVDTTDLIPSEWIRI